MQNFLNLDDIENYKNKTFVLNCLAQDFNFLKHQIKIYGKIYDVQLKLKLAKKKMDINNQSIRTAIILCGGRGLRLGSISKKFLNLWSKFGESLFCGT